MNKIKYIAAALIAVACLGLTAQAVTTNLGDATYAAKYTSPSDPYLLGTVIPTTLGGGGQAARDAAMTNVLINMTAGQQSGPNPGTSTNPLYSRSFNNFSPLPTATTTGNTLVPSGTFGTGFTGPVSIDLTKTGTFNYLVVAYDGPTSGVAVWDIAGLTGTITFDAYGGVEFQSGGVLETGNLLGANTATQGDRLITSWTLLNPTSVPDGGATVMLLGMALSALGMARRFLMG